MADDDDDGQAAPPDPAASPQTSTTDVPAPAPDPAPVDSAPPEPNQSVADTPAPADAPAPAPDPAPVDSAPPEPNQPVADTPAPAEPNACVEPSGSDPATTSPEGAGSGNSASPPPEGGTDAAMTNSGGTSADGSAQPNLTDEHYDWIHKMCGKNARGNDQTTDSGSTPADHSGSGGMTGVTPSGIGYSAPGTIPNASETPDVPVQRAVPLGNGGSAMPAGNGADGTSNNGDSSGQPEQPSTGIGDKDVPITPSDGSDQGETRPDPGDGSPNDADPSAQTVQPTSTAGDKDAPATANDGNDQGGARPDPGDGGTPDEATPDPEKIKGAISLEGTPYTFGEVKVDFKAVEVSFKCEVVLKGSVETSAGENGGEAERGGETTVTPVGISEGAIVSKVAHAWMDKDGVKLLGFDTAFTEVKVEGGIKTDNGFEAAVSGAGKLPCGIELELKLTVIKVEKDWKTKAGGLEVKGSAQYFPVSVDIGPFMLKDVQIQPSVACEISPNWAYIAAQLGVDVEEGALGEKAIEVTATLVGVDAAIVGGMLLAGVGTIGAAILTIQEGDEIAETRNRADQLAAKMTEGFRIGASGGGSAPDKEAMFGYNRGIKNFNEAKRDIVKKNPGADSAAVEAAIIAHVDEAAAAAAPQILSTARDTVWEAYARAHSDSWYHSNEFNRWTAWANIFGSLPTAEPLFMKYSKPGMLGTTPHYDYSKTGGS